MPADPAEPVSSTSGGHVVPPMVLSVNIGRLRSSAHTVALSGLTGIDKRPVDGSVRVRAPGPRGKGGSGLVGDQIGDLRHHGGDDQAVYAYAREDLDDWAGELGRELPNGCFGENLTTAGIDLAAALIGERWRIGADLVLEVSTPRIPCRTFAGWLGERGWIKRFTERARSGTYLRVIEPGRVRAGDPIEVIDLPDHDVTTELVFRALTRQPELLPRLLAADALTEGDRRRALKRVGMVPDDA